MRLWHILFAVFVLAMGMGIAREEVGRVAVIVFLTTLGEVFLGTSSLLMLFRTFGAMGMARSPLDYAEAIAATAGVLVVGAGSMVGVMWCGAAMVTLVVK
jgi:hypothetical protein